MESIERSSQLILDDYDMLSSVDSRYCNPSIFRKTQMERLELWLKGGSSNEWVVKTIRRSDSMLKSLEDYQRFFRKL